MNTLTVNGSEVVINDIPRWKSIPYKIVPRYDFSSLLRRTNKSEGVRHQKAR
jgi:hypothetical protein